MIKRIASAVVYVSDQDEAVKFYRDVLDFEVVLVFQWGGGISRRDCAGYAE